MNPLPPTHPSADKRLTHASVTQYTSPGREELYITVTGHFELVASYRDQIKKLKEDIRVLQNTPHPASSSQLLNSSTPQHSKEGILDEAIRITGGDRQRDYGHPRINHERIARLWNAYLNCRKETGDISPEDAAWMMMFTKVARHVNSPKRDNLVDTAGYARCIARIGGFEE